LKEKEITTIKIAILAEEPLGWPSGKHYFPLILNGFSWEKNNRIYKFLTNYIYDKDILQGKLNIKNYDTLLVPGGGVGDAEAIVKSFNFLRKVRKWRSQIKKFVEDGGGYVGICGGVTLFTNIEKSKDKKRLSFFERHYNEKSIGISCVKHYYKNITFRYLLPFQNNPEEIGAIAYVFSFAPGETRDNKKIHTAGVPVDFNVLKDNPIFSDYKPENIRIRWWGGPALSLPKNLDREIKIIAKYPKNDFSLDPKTKIYAWKYTGGFYGLIKSFFTSLKMIKQNNESLKNVIMYLYYFAKPWKKTNKIIDLDFSDKPSMVSEIYPNENRGRIFLCTSHPEYMIWWDGHIEELEANKDNCVATGFHKWKNIKPLSENVMKELTYTWWIVRKITAWAGKVPDEDLPPISKDLFNKDIENIINENIFWDGTLAHQIKNI
jgi:imidazoleglycerol phosphate synthase glutamine amidotransferase subunit HisH